MLTAALLTSVLAFGDTYTDTETGLVWTYTASSGKATLSGVERQNGGDLAGSLTIPSSVNGATVVAICERFCADTAIESLIIGF